MPIQVIMPKLGESVEEATITKWLKATGDSIGEFEALLEVNTDKVDTEIPSPATGVLVEILAPEGKTVQAGEVLAWIGQVDETLAPAPVPVQTSSPGNEAEARPDIHPLPARGSAPMSYTPGRSADVGFISPVVARLANEHKIDLYLIKGSGKDGRITKQDLLAYLNAQPVAPAAQSAASQASHEPPSEEGAGAKATNGIIMPLTPVRRLIAEHMVRSKRTSPHVSTIIEADVSHIVTHRQANKETFARAGVNLTFTAYFIYAAVSALKAYPLVNSSWSEEGILLHREINIGMATSLGEEGLIVPVIKNADSLSLLGMGRAINDLAARARAHQLKPDEVKGGTFTITNHGTSGSLFATPIINQPQCAILGVGAIQKRVVVISNPDGSDLIAIRPMIYLSLTFDHRILDGAIGDYFLGKMVESLQNIGN